MRAGLRTTVSLVAVLAALAPASASAATITVNSTGDTSADDGSCTLREAITAANNNAASGLMAGECTAGNAGPTVDDIEFSITGAGPHVIAPTAELTTVTETVTIDGSTDGSDEIALDGAPNDVAAGLRLAAPATATGLSIYGFGTGVVFQGGGAAVENSFIGTNEAGAAGIGNGGDGVSVSASNAVIRGNVISGNGGEGVVIFTSGALVAGNRIGTNPAGTAALANGSGGIDIRASADSVTIGGTTAGDANLIAGNTGHGIEASETSSVDNPISGTTIQGNRIGTRIGGLIALPNSGAGISLMGNVSGTTIADSLISGNGADGIELRINAVQPVGSPGPSGNTLAGNLIGTDKDGSLPVGNTANGILIQSSPDHPASDNVIGGTSGLTPGGACTGDCNVVADSGNTAIQLTEGTIDTQVLGNYIGTDVAGDADLGNDGGLSVLAAGTTIGSPAAPNVISGNAGSGVALSLTAAGSTVQGNLIGLGSDGSTALGNDFDGVDLGGANGILVGGTGAGEGNLIHNNDDEGVFVPSDSTNNAILGNSIFGNGGLGIDLGTNGVTANDADDPDVGANDLQNFPVLDVAAVANSTIVRGTLNSTPSQDFRIEVFDNADTDPTSHGEGQSLLGAFEVTTDASGDAEFTEVLNGTAGTENEVSATATELDGEGDPLSTSEFSLNVDEGCDIEGTSGDDPALSGTGADEIICGFEGNDVIDGGGGDDVIIGGTDTDEVDYSDAGDAIEADLGEGTVMGVGADGDDLLFEVEDVRGTAFDDTLLGDGAENTLIGKGGLDTLEGKDGDDKLKGSAGGDTLKGGDGTDNVKGHDGGDTLKGQSGDADDLSAGAGKDNLNGGSGDDDDCNGGGNDDDTPAPGCEIEHSIP